MDRRMVRIVGWVTLAVLIGAAPVEAQNVEQRARLEQFREQLAQAEDSSALLEGERESIASAKVHRDSTLLHLELGFLAFRIGEITATRKHYDDAASEFEWASELEP